MTAIFNVFLALHIVGGSVGLLTGAINVARKKGDKKHKSIGKLFLVSMLTAGISSLILASIHPNYFLFMVGVFTLYMVGSGHFYLKKRTKWTITILMLLAGILFIGIGVFVLINANLFGLVFLTFGSLGLVFVKQDFNNYTKKSTLENYWLTAHIQRMMGSFIASLTAFLVVNASYFPQQIPGFVYWILPTLIFTPLIVKWVKKYGIKKK